MALDFSTLRKPANPQVVDPATGRMREEWQLYFDQLTTRLNGAVAELSVDPNPGDVFGPASATDNAIARFDGATGKLLQDSTATLSDTGALTTPGIIRSTDNGASGGSLVLDGAGNIGIEIGRRDGNSSTPYIDLHSGATATDYDVRLIASGGTGSNGGGLLTINAAAGVSIGTTAPLTAGTVELGNASDTTLARSAAGFITIEGKEIAAPASATQGDIIYRDASHWVRLAAGTSGQFLQTLGGGANPQWAAVNGGITTIASGSLPAATTLAITSIPGTYAYLVLQISGVSSNTATRQPFVRVSTNNGSSYDATAANYEFTKFDINTPVAETISTVASLIETASGAANNTWDITIEIFNYQGGPNMMWRARAKNTISGIAYIFRGTYLGATSAINALQILWNGTGNFDAGTYALYGIS